MRRTKPWRCAQANADLLGVAPRARLVAGDWRQAGWAERLDQLGGPFDLLVSNPPYIESATVEGLMPEVANHEPWLALDGGADGLAAYRDIAAGAPRLVVRGGWVMVEGGEGQAPDIAALFAAAGLHPRRPARIWAASIVSCRPSIMWLAIQGE